MRKLVRHQGYDAGGFDSAGHDGYEFIGGEGRQAEA
jgi:hypothetical protein